MGLWDLWLTVFCFYLHLIQNPRCANWFCTSGHPFRVKVSNPSPLLTLVHPEFRHVYCNRTWRSVRAPPAGSCGPAVGSRWVLRVRTEMRIQTVSLKMTPAASQQQGGERERVVAATLRWWWEWESEMRSNITQRRDVQAGFDLLEQSCCWSY